MRLNLLLLMAITFLPFPTKLMAEAIHDDSAERAAVIAYGLNLLAISIVFSLVWEAVIRRPGMLVPDVSQKRSPSSAVGLRPASASIR